MQFKAAAQFKAATQFKAAAQFKASAQFKGVRLILSAEARSYRGIAHTAV